NIVTDDVSWSANDSSAVVLTAATDQTISGAGTLSSLGLEKAGGDVVLAEDIELGNVAGGNAVLTGTATDHIVGRLSLVQSNASLNFLGVIDALDIDVANKIVYLPADLNIQGDLHVQALHSIQSSGNLRVGGNVVTDDVSWSAYNSSAVVLTAATDQTISGAGTLSSLGLEKAGGDVVLAEDIELGNVAGGNAVLTGTATDHIVGRLSLVQSNASLNFLGVIDALDIDVPSHLVVYLPSDVNIPGDLRVQSLNSIRSGGDLRVGGNVVTNDALWSSYNDSAVVLTAATDQTISGAGALAYLVLEKAGGDVLLAEDIELNNPIGTAVLSGTVTDHIIGRLAVVKTARFDFAGVVDDVLIDAGGTQINLTSDVSVANTLTLQALGVISGSGHFRVGGDVTSNDVSFIGDFIGLTGAGDQQLLGTGVLHNLDIAKSGGDVLLGAFTTFSAVTVTAGQWDVLGETVTATFSATGGTFTGNGTLVGNVTINAGGGLAPGAPVGTLNVDGNLVMAPGATLDVDINGATAGTEHDQVVVTGTVNIDDAALTGTATAQPGSPVVIVANDAADPITGAGVTGVAEGGTVTLSSAMFLLTYVGDDGNDLVLQAEPCGNDQLDGDEECDDGNTVDGDCCDSACQFEPPGTLCGDTLDDACHDPDTCDDAGLCLANDETDDTDDDNVLDCEDGCPLDGNKTEPGVCDCGFPDDFNECVEGTAGCSVNATCTDLLCDFQCDCDAGFTGDGFTCAAIDYCETVTPICAAIEDGGAGGAVFWGVLEQGDGSLRGFRCITQEPGAIPICDTVPGTTTLQTFDPMCSE
ncbi:MAG: fibronectin-binding autotransporter adhesin, partial [Myxococcota bacterium]